MVMRNKESHVELIKKFSENQTLLIAFYDINPSHSGDDIESEELYIQYLTALPVTKLSIFSDNIWDYNDDVINPARNVQGAKLKIDFSRYTNIPPFIITEMKCLFHYLLLAPLSFTKKRGRQKGGSLKPNTVISQFKSGLKFLDHVFGKLNIDGANFVAGYYKTLGDVLEGDFRNASKDYSYAVGATIKKFFEYLKHPLTSEVLGHNIQIDFDSMAWPEQHKRKREARLVFENNDYEKLVSRSAFRIVEFLNLMNMDIEDEVASRHYKALKSQFTALDLTPKLINDYILIRLLSKGYSQGFIEEKCNINSGYLNEDGSLLTHEKIRVLAKKKHNISHFDNVRKNVNEIYYACCYIVGQYTGMRPSALSEVRLSSCLISEGSFDLIASEEKKGKSFSLNLFDDKWVAIPIVKDAIKAARVLSVLKNNDYMFSNMDTVKAGNLMTNMDSSGIKHFFGNFFGLVLGETKTKKIKFTSYMMRHTLAYQLHRAELGLPFISFQLKHLIDRVGKYTSDGATSEVTLGYGEIADSITRNDSQNRTIRRMAEVERVKAVMNPDGTYIGLKGEEHKERIKKAFEGYMASGYSHEQIYEAMAEQGLAIVNVGTGFCYGGTEDFDESLPCIGTLRCNPIRCKNAIVSKANAPKWREVYLSNKVLLGKDGYQEHEPQILAAMNEAEAVLKLLGEGSAP